MLSRFRHDRLCNPMHCSPSGSSVHRILQARILEWLAMPSSRASSWPRGWTRVSYVSALAGGFLTLAPPGKPIYSTAITQKKLKHVFSKMLKETVCNCLVGKKRNWDRRLLGIDVLLTNKNFFFFWFYNTQICCSGHNLWYFRQVNSLLFLAALLWLTSQLTHRFLGSTAGNSKPRKYQGW